MTTFDVVLLTLTFLATAVAMYGLGKRTACRSPSESPTTIMRQLQKRIADLREELESERMKVVACGIATLLDDKRTRPHRITDKHRDWSPSYEDVCRLVDRYAAQRDVLAAIADGSCGVCEARERAARALGRGREMF